MAYKKGRNILGSVFVQREAISDKSMNQQVGPLMTLNTDRQNLLLVICPHTPTNRKSTIFFFSTNNYIIPTLTFTDSYIFIAKFSY